MFNFIDFEFWILINLSILKFIAVHKTTVSYAYASYGKNWQTIYLHFSFSNICGATHYESPVSTNIYIYFLNMLSQLRNYKKWGSLDQKIRQKHYRERRAEKKRRKIIWVQWYGPYKSMFCTRHSNVVSPPRLLLLRLKKGLVEISWKWSLLLAMFPLPHISL